MFMSNYSVVIQLLFSCYSAVIQLSFSCHSVVTNITGNTKLVIVLLGMTIECLLNDLCTTYHSSAFLTW